MPTIVSMLPVEKGHAGLVQAQADKAKNFFGGAMKAAGVHVAAMRWRMNAQDADDTEVRCRHRTRHSDAWGI